MKKILFVSHSGGLAGAETVLLEELKILQEVCEIYLLLPCDSELFYRKIKDEDIKIKSVYRMKYRLYGNHFLKVLLKSIYNIYPILKLVSIIKKNNIDIVYSNSIVNWVGVLAAIIAGKKHVFHFHELPSKEEKYIDYRLDFLLKKIVKARRNTNIFISKKMKTYWEERLVLNGDGHIVYNLIKKIDESKSENIACDEFCSFGFAGTFYERKNIVFLLACFLELVELNKNVKLYLAGDGPQMGELEALVNTYKLNNKVIFMGGVDKIEDFFKNIDILILPSIAEAMPLIVLEAIKAKKLCLVTSQTGLDELLVDKKHCFYFDPNDKEGLVYLMKYVSNEKKVVSQMVCDAYKLINSTFDSEVYLNNLIDILEERGL